MDTFLTEKQFKDVFESHIKIETYSKSVDSLFLSNRNKGKINYKPYYQRNYVWDDSKASYFIESILLGTEIPPLIFFDEGKTTEVIDGRQRYETIKRFVEGDFSLSKDGLTSLSDLSKKNIHLLREQTPAIHETFLDAKVRIIEFKLVNNPPSDPALIDKIKKEIFGRYNSGITPLKIAEIDNAVYDSDKLSQHFKNQLSRNKSHFEKISKLFLRQMSSSASYSIEGAMQFIRKSLVIYKFPIKTYASGKSRVELISKFYEFNFSEIEDPDLIFQNFMKKIDTINIISEQIQSFNRLFNECLLWGINITDEEGFDYLDILTDENLKKTQEFLLKNSSLFDPTDSHYAKETVNRYNGTATLFSEIFNINFAPYLQLDKSPAKFIAEVTQNNTYKEELEKLESLRITKPDPSRNTIDDLIRAMGRSRFLVRPSYQRSEVINLAKSSAIIESMLLGIMLPAIFIYKRNDGVSEVIDGQQRLLTILGFVGEKYIDENGTIGFSKNHKFKLKNLRILDKLSGLGFENLADELKDRILDFDLFVVEIEERLNPDFNPVDLFIRLNDKPYPIKENSFEMWNSWVTKEVVEKIKEISEKYGEWFYIKSKSNENFRDRMNNEELITILSYFTYKKIKGDKLESYIDIHQKGGRINARIKKKMDITSTLLSISESDDERILFAKAIDETDRFINNILDLFNNCGTQIQKNSLDILFSSGSSRRYYTRTLQDFYILWVAINPIKIGHENSQNILNKLVTIFSVMKKSAHNVSENSKHEFEEFNKNIKHIELFKI